MALSNVKKIDTLEILILAAGQGTRMKSKLPKVLQPVCGHPLLEIVLTEVEAALLALARDKELAREKALDFGAVKFNVVIGHERERVRSEVENLIAREGLCSEVTFTVQEEQLGTGHAVREALRGSKTKAGAHWVAVINGDLPLLTGDALADFFRAHSVGRSAASLLSGLSSDMAGAGDYGRVLRKGGEFAGVVEARDASKAQLKIREFNGGVYLFDRALLEEAIVRIGARNSAKEFYLPDVFEEALRKKRKILAHRAEDAAALSGANTMAELAAAEQALYARAARRWMAEGVRLSLPDTVRIGPRVRLGAGVSIDAFTRLSGRTSVGEGSSVGSFCDLRDVAVGARCEVRAGVVASEASIGDEGAVGPMAHLRPGSRLARAVRVGNFVEVKESSIGESTNVAHLSYVGDAEIGAHANIGCGFVTCNYDGVVRDGRRKHRTKIGDRVFIGSDCQVVAPIELCEGTYVASGSTVTESVREPDSLVVSRARQVTKPGYARKYRKKG